MKEIKYIGEVIFRLRDGVYQAITEEKSSRKNSWITIRQITEEFPEFFDKLEEIFTAKDPSYTERAKSFAENIYQYIELWGWLSWKQFDSIWRMCSTYQDYLEGKKKGFYTYAGIVSVKHRGVSFTVRHMEPGLFSHMCKTDKGMDSLHEKLFGHRPMYEEEEEGMELMYRNDGSRYFALPTGRESLYDHMHFGINFKGLSI